MLKGTGKVIGLTKGMITLVDPKHYTWLNQWRWSYSRGYAVRGRRRNGKSEMILMHREILIRSGVDIPDDYYADHINGNRLDNRRTNLRVASPQQSAYNTIKSKSNAVYRGVSYMYAEKDGKKYVRRKPWLARIRANKKVMRLGYFATAEEAAKAYDEAALEYHGEFATLNFPKE